MKNSAFEPINSQFLGKKWGVRLVLFFFYFLVLIAGGMISAIPDTSELMVGFIGAIAISIMSIPIFRATKNMFENKYLQYGFYLILIMLIGGHASTKKTQAEEDFFEYYTEVVVPGMKEFALEIEEGEIPYTNREEARVFLSKRYPKYMMLWEEMRLWSFMQTTTGLLVWPLLLLWGGSLVLYKRRLGKWPAQLHEATRTTPEVETIDSKSNANVDQLDTTVSNESSSDYADEDCVAFGTHEEVLIAYSTVMHCSVCETDQPKDYQFCPDCGAKLTITHCPNCDAEVSDGFVFCAKCGSSLSRDDTASS